MKAEKSPIQSVMSWIRRQPPKVKAFLGVVLGMTVLVFLRVIVHEHDNLFIASEAVHALGISVLIYKLTKEKTCAGIIGIQICWLLRFRGFLNQNRFFDTLWKILEFWWIWANGYGVLCFKSFIFMKYFDDLYRDITQDTGANGFVSGCAVVL